MKSKPFPWPKKGNKAFASAESGKSFHLKSIFWSYPQHAGAFKLAAEMVIDRYEDDPESPYHDELLFPVAYLYRHCLEIKLKDLIRVGIAVKFFKRADVKDVLNDHNLAKLWTKVKKLVAHRWPNEDPTPLNAAEAIVNEFHQADPNGQVFRYDRDNGGRPHRYDKLPEFISLAKLRNTVDGVYTFLDTCRDVLQDDHDLGHE